MPRLWLAAVAPLALVRIDLVNLVVEVGPYRRVPGQKLVVAAGRGLSCAAKLLSTPLQPSTE